MWFIWDGLGISLGVLTWVLLAFADWVVVQYVFVGWFRTATPRINWIPCNDVGLLAFFVYQALILLTFTSHFRAATTDPGTIEEFTAPSDFLSPKVCKLCQGRWKPPRAHHCKTCHRCIFRMDHHCPWINNCVGLSNQKLFILFLVYTATSAVITLLLLITSSVCWLWSQSSWSEAAPPSSTTLMCSGMAAVECLAALLFVSDFLSEQIESIQMNSTLVETYQRTHGERGTFREHFRSVFGHRVLAWPWPYPSNHPPRYAEPALKDDGQDSLSCTNDDTDSLGIAGMESEDAAQLNPVGRGEAPRLMQRELRHLDRQGADGEKRSAID
mmetsp:Transcript_75041/g.168348  ORF Transcript_75041/g.168348 Transcript_75041/m.168348 type:complete len:328 (+) Transcript_75041:186-1169(+)